MLTAEVDWTNVLLAAIGLAGSIISAWIMLRVRVLELRAAEDARRSERAAKRSEDSAVIRIRPKRKKGKRGPTHPDG